MTQNQSTSKIFLPDGSSVSLNANSKIIYPSIFSEERKVNLSGEAYFSIQKSEKPFILNLGKMKVKVYGTEFLVNAYDTSNIETILIEGSVGILNDKNVEVYRLKPNQKIVFNPEHNRYFVTKVNPDFYTAWKDGKFLFKKTSLKKIFKQLETWHDINVICSNDSIRKRTFTGIIDRTTELDEILKLIEFTTSTNIKILKQDSEKTKVFITSK
jgi:ferric-dicitrate binding protein FerR (iron transport regulator)